MGTPFKVFISYSHDSEAHRQRVLALADWLNHNGVDCDIDQYLTVPPPEGWPLWMENMLEQASHVLVVCTETYFSRVKRKEKRGIGKGVKWESLLTYQEIYDDDGLNRKFIPVVFSVVDAAFIPKPLRSVSHYDLGQDGSYEKLLRHLLGKPKAVKPALGEQPTLPPVNVVEVSGTVHRPLPLKSPSIPLLQRGKPLLFIGFMALAGIGIWYGWQQQVVPVGESLLQQGEYEQAQQECEVAPPSSARDLCLSITSLMLEPRDVEKFYADAIREDSAYALAVMGEAAAAQEDFVTAEKHYTEAIQHNPAVAQAYFGMGQIRQAQNQPDEALTWYQQAVEHAPQNRRFILNLASVYAEKGELEKAEANYRKVLSLDKSVMLAYIELIDVLLQQQKMAEAAELAQVARQGVADNPDWKDKPLNAQEWFVMQNDGQAVYLQTWEQKQDYMNRWFGMADHSL